MSVLEVGERSRSVAATHLNQYSSRSHTLFIVEIIQRYPNQSEKRGRLNLVDLAGSEKIGKTGAVGETLEEAKKINLSLSCLGNVIHSLTSNAEHVPFRDSKLTRILQESLGGNYKTSLIVTCSPHSFNREETISTLKFATRAKTIKTHYKVNIMNSPESMARLIEQLRGELDAARIEIQMLKNGETPEKILEAQQMRRETTDTSPFKGLQTYNTEGEVRRSSSQTQLRDR
jgi:kinesin family protein 5